MSRWLLGLGLLLGVAAAKEARLEGRAALRSVYSASEDAPTVSVTFLETDANAMDLTGAGGLRLRLDATFILDLTDERRSVLDGDVPAHERRFGRTEGFDQVRQLYAQMPKLLGHLDVSAGRRYVQSAGNPWVDGFDLELWFDQRRASVGLYGGLRPDPFDYAVSADQQATGIYGTLHREGFDGSLAYNAVLRGDSLDRQFVFNRLHYRVTRGLYLASYLTLDATDEVDTSVLLLTADYTPVQPLNLTLNLSRYSLERYRDQTIYHDVVEANQAVVLGDEVLSLVYQRARFSVSYRFFEHLVHYQWTEYKSRAQDGRDAWLYTVGLRADSLWGTGLRIDGRGTLRNNFDSDSWLVGLELARDLPGHLAVEAWMTWFSGRTVGRARATGRGDDETARTFDETQEILWVGGRMLWRPLPAHQLHLDYDAMVETELQDARNQDELLIHTFMFRYAWVL